MLIKKMEQQVNWSVNVYPGALSHIVNKLKAIGMLVGSKDEFQ